MGCEGNVPPGGMCSSAHCIQYIQSSDAKAYCDCKNWKGQPIPDCTKKGANEPTWTNECYDNIEKKADPNVSYEQCKKLILKDPERYDWRKCACCCSCYAWYTKIAVAGDAVKIIQDFEVGDEVYVASVSPGTPALQLSWESRVVDFSDGTSPNETGQEMLVIKYRMGKDEGELTINNDQLLLTPEGRLKSADRWLPGENLVREDGTLSQIVSIRSGPYKGGIHHIATPLDLSEGPSINGHLLSSNGVVTGDYWTQLFHITEPLTAAERLLVDGHADLPVFGSEAYTSLPGIRATLFSAVLKGKELTPVRNPFFAEREESTGEITFPAETRSYFTKGQAANISKAPHVPASQQRNVANFRYLQQLLAGFYPDINLYMNWEDDVPNLHAFTQFGQQTVYISGRLLRTEAVEMEGLAALLGHGIAVFLAGPSPDPADYPCKAVADYYGLGYVLKEALNFTWADTATEGYNQLSNLFSFIKGKNRNGDPKMPCTQPSVDCRLQSLDAALSGFNVPACADGPQPGMLRLESAEATIFEGQTGVTASFNEAVNFTTASNVTNYQITPVAEITTALRNDPQMKQVVLTVKFPDPPEGEYTLAVSDILSANGSTLNPDGKTAAFTVKAPPAAKAGGKRRK